MMQLNCPWCGPRNVSEFHHRGEAVPRPATADATPQQWRDYLYTRANTAGWTTELWHHQTGCRRFFSVERNTWTNETRQPGSADGAGAPETAPSVPAAEQGRQL